MEVGNAVLLAQQNGGEAAAAVVSLLCMFVFILVPAGLIIFSVWKVFEKAGEPGWAAIVPIYNGMVMCRIAGKPEWWVLLMFIPLVGIVFSIIVLIAFAEKFGAGGGFAVGLILLPFIFFPMLAFGSYEYEGRRRKKSRRRDYDDEDDDYESRKPRRSRADDDDDQPRRRRRADDDEDDRPRRPRRRDDDE